MDKQKSGQRLILFLFDDKDVDLALKTFGLGNLKASKCFAFGASAYRRLAELEILSYEYSSYFDPSRAEGLNNLASNWARGWYKKCNMNIKFNGFNPLSTLELSLHNYFAKKLFQFVCIEEIIKKEKPSVLVIGMEEKGMKNMLVSNFDSITPVIKFAAAKRRVYYKFLKAGLQWYMNQDYLKFIYLCLASPLVSLKGVGRNTDYIFLGHHYHIQNILPVLEKLKKGNKKVLVVGRLGETMNILKKREIDVLEIAESWTISFKNLKIRALLIFKAFNLKSDILKAYFQTDSTSLWNIFRSKISSVIVQDCLKVWFYSNIALELIKDTSPKGIINISSDSSIQSFIKIAKSQQVPTLEIQHGFTVGSDSQYIRTDKFAVWGKIPKKIYRKSGVNEWVMEITGWPAFEIYKNIKTKTTRVPTIQTITFLAQDPEGVSLLFMKNTLEQNLEIFFSAISELGSKVRVKVRLHPRASGAIVSAIARIYGVDFELSNNERESLKDLLEVTDIVVGQSTSATIDSILMHKPVIYLPSMEWPAAFVKGTGAVFTVNDSKDLTMRIDEILKKGISKKMISEQNKFANNYCNFSDDSVNNIINQILILSKK